MQDLYRILFPGENQDITEWKLQQLSTKYLIQLLNGALGDEEKYKLNLILGLSEKPKSMIAIKLMLDSEEEALRDIVTQAFEPIGKIPHSYEMVFPASNFIVVFWDDKQDEIEKKILSSLQRITEHVCMVMALGLIHTWQDIVEAWKLINPFMDYCFYRGNMNKSFQPQDIEKIRQINSRYCYELQTRPEENNLDTEEQILTYCNQLRGDNIDPEQLRMMVLARMTRAKFASRIAEFGKLLEQIPYLLFEELRDVWVRIIKAEEMEQSIRDVSSRIEHYIYNHFQRHITIRDMATDLNYNELYLGKLIKKEMGMSFRQYLNKVRLDHAEVLLWGSYDSIVEVAHKSGFFNSDYFCKKFRERNGCTPSEFRHNKKQVTEGGIYGVVEKESFFIETTNQLTKIAEEIEKFQTEKVEELIGEMFWKGSEARGKELQDRWMMLVFRVLDERLGHADPQFQRLWQKERASKEHGRTQIQRCVAMVMLQIMEEKGVYRERPIPYIKMYIEQKYDENVSLQELASKIYMNKAYLGQKFKKETGISINDYLQNERIKAAVRLADTTDWSWQVISAKVGYANYLSFLKYFVKVEGVLPSDYR